MNEPRNQIPRQISKWLCHKLECFSDYIDSIKNTGYYYLELFAGCGSCTCKGTDCIVDGSELRALKTKNRFNKCIFVVKDTQDAKNLKKLTATFNTDNSVAIITGNCIREKVMRQAFDLIPRSAASFALIDPSGYTKLRWSTIRKLAAHSLDWSGHKMELLIIFQLEMAILRNLTRPECETSINRLYGNQKWQQVRQKIIDDKIDHDKSKIQLVSLFKAGLKSLKYRYVEDLKPARFSNPPYYHIIWASDTSSRIKELANAWGKTRYLPCELFHDEKKV
jgi:three-Cys-motif partner protein